MEFLKRHWKHFAFFGLYLAVLLVCRAPDISQVCKSDDCFSFLYGAKFFEHKYPVPLWNVLGYIFANLPFGNDGGNLALFLSVIPAFLTSIVVFLAVKKQTDNKYAPWIGSATLMGCYLYFSQAVIMEIYMLLALLFSLAYLMLIYKKYTLASVFCGLGIAAHYMTGIVPFLAFFLVSGGFRKRSYIALLIAIVFLVLYYSFVPIFSWELLGSTGSQYNDLYEQIIATIKGGNVDQPYIGIWMVAQMLVVGFGLSLIPMFLFAKDLRKSNLLLFLCFFPLIYVIVGGVLHRFTQLPPFAPFFAIMAGLGVSKIKMWHLEKIILLSSLVMLISCLFLFNVRILDESPTTARQEIELFDEAEDGSLICCVRLFDIGRGMMSDTLGGHVAPTVEYYNRTHDKHLIPVYIQTLYDKGYTEYIKKLYERGVVLPDSVPGLKSAAPEDMEWWYLEIMKIFVDLNPDFDVYYLHIVNIENQKCELVKVS